MTRTPSRRAPRSTRALCAGARGLWLLALAVLMLALALAACTGRAVRNGGTTPSNPAGSAQSSSSSGGQGFSSDDQAIQSLMQQLNGAANDANMDYSSQDSPIQP